MTIYDINIVQQSNDLLPSGKRTTENVAQLKGFLGQFDRNHQLFLAYKFGAKSVLSALTWAAGTFGKGEYVYYIPTGEVFECQKDTTAEPTTSTDWLKVLDSFIGTDESQYFDGSILSLTYALNTRFDTVFNNPPATSDIYIVNEVHGIDMFYVGANDAESSYVGANDYESSFITYNDTTPPVPYLFTIWIPAALTAQLGTNAFKIIRQFADKYVTAGCLYDVTDY